MRAIATAAVLVLAATPAACLASDTYTSTQWNLLLLMAVLTFLLPVYGVALAVFLPLRRFGNSARGLWAHAVPFAVTCVLVGLAGSEYIGLPLAVGWGGTALVYGWLLGRFGTRKAA